MQPKFSSECQQRKIVLSTEILPPGIIISGIDLYLRRLWGFVCHDSRKVHHALRWTQIIFIWSVVSCIGRLEIKGGHTSKLC
jgi:hypothetical protein